jgi:hypothetical protein
MKSERIRNHDAHITYTLQLLSSVLCTLRSVPVARVCCANLQPASKLLVTMDSTSSVMIPSLAHSIINSSHPACFSFTIRVYALSVIFPASPEFSRCGKADFHQLCCEPGQSRLSHFLHLKSWFGACWSFPQASLSGDSSSHGHPFILRVFPCHAQIFCRASLLRRAYRYHYHNIDLFLRLRVFMAPGGRAVNS